MRTRAIGAACVLLALGSPARGAERAGLELSVRMTRPWFGPSSPLTVEVELTSRMKETVPNLRASVALFERVRSRSELRRAWEGKLPRTPLQAFTYRLEDLPPGASQRMKAEQDFATLPAFQGAPDGLYPLTVTIRQSTGPAIKSVTTAVAFASEAPQNPMRLVAVLAIVPPPLLGPGGALPHGLRDRLLSLRRRLAGLPVPLTPFGLAVSPVLLDELRAMKATVLRSEAADLEAALREVAAGAEVLSMPYAYADLSALQEVPGSGGVADQLEGGREALKRVFGSEPQPVVYPPDLRLDPRSLSAMRASGIKGAVVGGSMAAAASRGLTPAEPATSSGITLLPSDELLDRALLDARSDTDLSRVVAETAMVYFEGPARQRTLTVAVPLALEPARFGSFLASAREAPWLEPIAPTAAAAQAGRALRSPRYPELLRPPRTFTRSLADARRAVGELAAFTAPGNPAGESLGLSLAAALGTAWWNDDWARGARWARGIVTAVERNRRYVSTSGTAPVTFTSRRGEVPITVVNRGAYPVRIRVEILSPKLEFPRGSSRLLDPLDPPGRTVTFSAITEATGTFPLKVRLTSPDGAVLVHEEELVVRSTAVNVVALAITVGAGLFLVGWSVRRFAVRRRNAA